jgi:hypothetical protein
MKNRLLNIATASVALSRNAKLEQGIDHLLKGKPYMQTELKVGHVLYSRKNYRRN